MLKNNFLITTCLLLLSTTVTWGQCTQILTQAEREFEAGRLLGIPNMLEECLETDGFSEEEEIRAHKLLTQVFIFSDQESRADASMINLLKADPEHQLDENFDPAELFYLYEQFRVDPIFRVGVKVGGNYQTPFVINKFSAFPNDPLKKNYSSGIGFNVELSIERHLKYGIEASMGFMFRNARYSFKEVWEDGNINTEINDVQSWFKLPIQARYTVNYGKRDGFLPYLFVGGAPGFLLSANLVDSERLGGNQRTANNYNLVQSKERNRLNFTGFAGIGVKLHSKTHFITIESRYEISVLNYVNPENRFASNENIVGLAYVSDDLSLSYISLTLGYTRSIYDPKKKKKFTNR